VARTRAADDFAAIRARMDELAHERARAQFEQDRSSATGPRPYHPGVNGSGADDERALPRAVRPDSYVSPTRAGTGRGATGGKLRP
jgi:hypothetical protein